MLTTTKRARLQALRAEDKLRSNDWPPLGYAGPETPEDGAIVTLTINAVLDEILKLPDGPVTASAISPLLLRADDHVAGTLLTADREQVWGYMLEIWWTLGFKGRIDPSAPPPGEFYAPPEGFGESLPPGWTSPLSPRPVG